MHGAPGPGDLPPESSAGCVHSVRTLNSLNSWGGGRRVGLGVLSWEARGGASKEVTVQL